MVKQLLYSRATSLTVGSVIRSCKQLSCCQPASCKIFDRVKEVHEAKSVLEEFGECVNQSSE